MTKGKKMAAFVIGEIEVSEESRKGFENIFLTQAHKELEDAGAKIVAGGFDNAVSLTGTPPKNRYVVIQFREHGSIGQMVAGTLGRICQRKTQAIRQRWLASYRRQPYAGIITGSTGRVAPWSRRSPLWG